MPGRLSCTFMCGTSLQEPRDHAELLCRPPKRSRSHVRRPPSAHMGDHQLFVTNRGKPRIFNEKLLMFCGAPTLPCATRLGARVECELNAAMRSRSR